MFEKLEAVEKRYEELTKIISDPDVISNQAEWQKAMKEHDVSRKDLAKCLGVRYATVIDKLKGRTSFAFEDAEKVLG